MQKTLIGHSERVPGYLRVIKVRAPGSKITTRAGPTFEYSFLISNVFRSCQSQFLQKLYSNILILKTYKWVLLILYAVSGFYNYKISELCLVRNG